jgi:glutaredoxin 3
MNMSNQENKKKVIIYTTPTCSFCNLAKKYFRDNLIDFREVNVALDRDGLKEMREKSGQMGIPVFDIGGRIIIGFDRKKIEDALNDLK